LRSCCIGFEQKVLTGVSCHSRAIRVKTTCDDDFYQQINFKERMIMDCPAMTGIIKSVSTTAMSAACWT